MRAKSGKLHPIHIRKQHFCGEMAVLLPFFLIIIFYDDGYRYALLELERCVCRDHFCIFAFVYDVRATVFGGTDEVFSLICIT
jgi:hypothetical protein